MTAAILAGGLATRMGGVAKGLLRIDGAAILDRQLSVLRPIFDDIVVVAAGSQEDEPAPFLDRQLRIVTDRYPGSGPLAGLHAALVGSSSPWLFAVACDMPFLDGDLIARMVGFTPSLEAFDALVPRHESGLQPLHALYRASKASSAEKCLVSGKRAMTDFLGAVRPRYIEASEMPALASTRSFVNLNSPGDIAATSEPL